MIKIKDNRIYLDNSASTPVDERVLREMAPYWTEKIGNAGSLHREGQEAKQAVETSRESIASSLNAQKGQIIFTSGGTESNNMAVLGTIERAVSSGKKIEDIEVITSKIEHRSVLDCFVALERKGVKVHYVPNDKEGKIHTETLEEMITDKTLLISVVYVNNEVGTIQNADQIKNIIRKAHKKFGGDKALLHLDASQAPVWLSLDVEKLAVDLLTLDSQKMYGPKGIGCLYIRNHDFIQQILYGGRQEMGMRPGTPPTPLIVGFAKAMSILEQERDTYMTHCRELQSWFIETVEKNIEYVTLNGPRPGEQRIAGNISFSIEGVEGERLVLELDAQGIACSTGSACLIEDSEGSHIIRALENKGSKPANTIRFTLHRETTKEEIEKTSHILVETTARLREQD